MERIGTENATSRMPTREEINAKRRLLYQAKKLQSGGTYKPRRVYTTRVAGRTAQEKRELSNKTRRETRLANRLQKQKEKTEREAREKAESDRLKAEAEEKAYREARRKALQEAEEKRLSEATYYEVEAYTFSLDDIFDTDMIEYLPGQSRIPTLTSGVKGLHNFKTLNAYLPFKKDEKFDTKLTYGNWREWLGRFESKISKTYNVFKTGMLTTEDFPKPGETRVSDIINVPSNGFTKFLKSIKPKKASFRHVKKLVLVSGGSTLEGSVFGMLSSLGVSESLLCWDITAVKVNAPMGTEPSTILSEYLYDGTSPHLLFPTSDMLEVPNTRRTCIPDILKKYDKQCFNLSPEQITERINNTWDKYKNLYYKSKDYYRCYGELEKRIEVEKDLKQLFDYTSMQHDNRLTASHLVVYCMYNRLQLSILDDETTLIMRVLTTEQIDKNKKAIMVYISNGHCYDVISKEERTRISNVRENNYVKVENKDTKTAVPLEDDKELPESPTDIFETSSPETYTTYRGLERLIIDMYESNNILPAPRSIKCDGTVPTRLTICGKTIIQNENMEKTALACKTVGRLNHNMSITSLTMEEFEKFEKANGTEAFSTDRLKSTFNDISLSFVQRLVVSAIQFNTKPSKSFASIETFDIRRCYTSVLMSITEWLTFSVFDDVKIFNNSDTVNKTCLYFVNTNLKNFLFEGAGVYTYDVVSRGLSDKLISLEDISHYIEGKAIRYDFGDFVNHIYSTFTSEEGGDSIAKDMVNMFIGCLNYRKGRNVKVSYSPNIGDVVDKYFRQGWSGYTSFDTSKGKLYKCLKITPPKDTHTLGLPVYAQIIQRGRCEMYDLSKQIKIGRIIQCKTDSISIEYTGDKRDTLSKSSYKFGLGSLRKSKMVDMKIQDSSTLKCKPFELPTISQVMHDERDDALIEKITKGGNWSVEGRAGSGKSVLSLKLLDAYKKLGKSVICSAYQNITIDRFNLPEDEAMTTHRLFGVNVDENTTSFKSQKCDVIFFEEISMIPSTMYRHIYRLYRENPEIQLIAFGHFAQLKPVGESGIEFQNSNVYKSVFNNRVFLTTNYRSGESIEFTKIQDDVEYNRIDLESVKTLINADKEFVQTDINLVVSNVLRKQINTMFEPPEGLSIESDDNNVYLQSYKLAVGSRLIRVNNDITKKYVKGLAKSLEQLSNGSMYVVKSIQDDVAKLVRLQDFQETDIEISVDVDKAIGYTFQPAYALTIYKSQGANIPYRHTVWEFDKIKTDRNYVYTTITRARKFSDIYIK